MYLEILNIMYLVQHIVFMCVMQKVHPTDPGEDLLVVGVFFADGPANRMMNSILVCPTGKIFS